VQEPKRLESSSVGFVRKVIYLCLTARHPFAHLLCVIKWVPSHCIMMHPQFVVGLHVWRVQQSRQTARVILQLVGQRAAHYEMSHSAVDSLQ
jgi:hypothetical protein